MNMNFVKVVITNICAVIIAVSATAAEYEIDTSHTTAMFKISHLGFSNTYGMIPDVSGSFSFDPDKPEASSIEVVAKVDSIDTQNEARDKHLKNEDFFDAEKYPEIQFTSTTWTKKDDDTFTVTGDFTLHGVTKEITFDANLVGMGEGMREEYRAGFETTFTIKRSDYGMDNMVGPIGDEVTLTIGFEGVRK